MCEILGIWANLIQSRNRDTQFRVIIIELRLDLGIRGLKIASRTNLKLGPRFAEVCKDESGIQASGLRNIQLVPVLHVRGWCVRCVGSMESGLFQRVNLQIKNCFNELILK